MAAKESGAVVGLQCQDCGILRSAGEFARVPISDACRHPSIPRCLYVRRPNHIIPFWRIPLTSRAAHRSVCSE